MSPPLDDRRTNYRYNFSGQLTNILRPDGESIFQDFDLVTGELNAQVPSVGDEIDYHYVRRMAPSPGSRHGKSLKSKP